MALSQAEIGCVVEELQPIVERGATLQKVREVDARTQVSRLRSPGETHYLLLSTRTGLTRLHLVDDPPSQPAQPTDFTMLLRKWLHGASWTSIEQIQGDRIVRLGLRVPPPTPTRGDEDETLDEPREMALVLELADRVGNVLLLDADDTILGRQTSEAIAGRDLERGTTWAPPPPPPDPEIGSEVRWELDALDPSSGARSEQVAEAYRTLEREHAYDQLLEDLDSRLANRVEKLERRIEHVQSDLEQVEEAETYRKWAELLQSAYGRVDKGTESVVVQDFYSESMEEVEIPLDPSKTLQENIENYYHEADRYENAREMVEQRLLESMELCDRAEAVLGDVRSGEHPGSYEALVDWRDELESEGVLEPRSDDGEENRDRKRRESRPYRTFEATSGKAILVGRGAESNDTLTVRVARGRDLWLHARDWPGAHVVLRMRKDEDGPTSDDLIDAATLAAHFSQGRNDTVVEVMYTRAKHVDKPKGFPAGRVSVAQDSTVGVRMEEERLERLLDSEER
jgi:predicted ribosome quality control (RQC) complex YloA/Tae2 family protein